MKGIRVQDVGRGDAGGLPLAVVVDDEALVRMLTCEHLAEAGYDCVEAESAQAGLDLLAERTEAVILVTDVRMPGGMDGVMLATKVAMLRPDLRIVVLSGGPMEAEANLPAGAVFLAKPFTSDALRAALATAVPARGG